MEEKKLWAQYVKKSRLWQPQSLMKLVMKRQKNMEKLWQLHTLQYTVDISVFLELIDRSMLETNVVLWPETEIF